MKKKIKKVTPIKSETLCQKCVNGSGVGGCTGRSCNDCGAFVENDKNKPVCYCTNIRYGQKCERYKRKPPSLQIGCFEVTNSEIGLNVKYADKNEQPSVSKAVEYIEIEKVIEILKNNTPILIPTGSGMRNVERLLKNAVATDVEKVVRCKNCEHSNDCKITVAKSMTMDAKGKVTFHRDIEHYCSKGKRKEV